MKRILLTLALELLTVPLVAGEVIDASSFVDVKLPDCGIQAAIDSLGKEGGEVKLPARRFELMRSLILPSNVSLTGAGVGKTVLAGKPTNTWVRVKACAGARLTLQKIPEGLKPGVSVFCWPKRPQTGWLGYYKPQVVRAIEGKTITLDNEETRLKEGGWLSIGLCSVLTRDCSKGDVQLMVADASGFVVGQSVTVGSGDGNANESLSFIREIEGNVLRLERPIRLDHIIDKHYFWKRPAVWSLFPLVTCEAAENITISDLSLEWNIPAAGRPKLRRYTLSPIHLFNARHARIENVHVENSFTDGISLQAGEDVVVRNCVVTDCHGNGLHPGTGLRKSVFEHNRCEGNGSGLYFCWHNVGHVLRHNKFVRNGAGITGLGNPGDRENVIENNLIAENRKYGLEINGGKESGNIIRRNTFRDNSQEQAGKYPAILIRAQVEDARDYTIQDNIFENVTSKPETQLTAIQEENGQRNGKPTVADGNVIRNNIIRSPQDARVIVVGKSTIVEQSRTNVQQEYN